MHFDKPGKDNTDKALKLAYERGKDLGLNEVVVASTSGNTAYKTLEIFKGFKISVVTYHCGFLEPFKNAMEESVKHDLRKKVQL
jgi:uncharacterized protein